jgi:hypothetical protein
MIRDSAGIAAKSGEQQLWVRNQWNAAFWTSSRADSAPNRWPTDLLEG